jgi:hypothetical protein
VVIAKKNTWYSGKHIYNTITRTPGLRIWPLIVKNTWYLDEHLQHTVTRTPGLGIWPLVVRKILGIQPDT